MAYKKSESVRTITLLERDYQTLLEDHIALTALKMAGGEAMPIYKSVRYILSNEHVEIRVKPLKINYR